MKKHLPALFLLGVSLLLAYCGKGKSNDTTPSYDSIPSSAILTPLVGEISGIADSKANNGYLWGEQDSGNPPEIFLIGHDGKVAKSVYIKGAVNRDWEDMTLCGTDLYVGDIGDINKAYADYTIYQFAEPPASLDTVNSFTAIRFKYADGSRDAEAFIVDPTSKDIYIITKSDSPSKIYKLSYPYNAGINTATAVGSLSYSGVVSAALSADRKEIVIKTYLGLSRYLVKSGELLETALQRNPDSVPYQLEPQGEAVCFAADNSGYYTLSEKGMSQGVNLYFYKRK